MLVRRAFAVLVAAAAAAAGRPAGAAGAAPPVVRPGVYEQINPATKKPADPGNQIVIVEGKRGRLAFSVNALRGPDLAQGFAVGTFPAGAHTVTWTQNADGVACKLTFTALGNGLRVVQDARFGDCGFGAGILADGTYVRRSGQGP